MRIGFSRTGTTGRHLRPEVAGPGHEVPQEPDTMNKDTAELALLAIAEAHRRLLTCGLLRDAGPAYRVPACAGPFSAGFQRGASPAWGWNDPPPTGSG